MPKEQTIPRRPALTDKLMLSLAEGSTPVLEGMAKDAGFDSVSAYARGILEREIATCRPDDFKRLRGVA